MTQNKFNLGDLLNGYMANYDNDHHNPFKSYSFLIGILENMIEVNYPYQLYYMHLIKGDLNYLHKINVL